MTSNFSNPNLTGPNHILRYNTRSHNLTDIDLSGAQVAFASKSGGRNQTNGFQDMAEDSAGNVYAIGTFGNSIVKILPTSSGSDAELWYVQEPYELAYGFGGIVALGDKLVVSDSVSNALVTFQTDLSSPTSPPQAVYVKPSDVPADIYPMADGLFAPSKYGGKVLLWSNDYNGTVVYGSQDGWESARYLGLIPNEESELAQGGLVTDTFEIEDNIFTVYEFFQTLLPPKRKEQWTFYDIPLQVDEIIKGSGMV